MSRKNKTSQRRIEANRLNAQKSTGPRTAEGKAKSAQNATTHGLTRTNPFALGCFLDSEDEQQFQIVLSEYIATYNPQHRDEYDLLSEAVYAKWRQQRFWLAETAQLEIAIARNEANLQKELPLADAGAHLANGVAHSEDLLRLYLRYGAQLHRQYLRCLKELRDLQASRLPPTVSPNEPNCEPDTSPDRQGGESPNEPNAHPNPARQQGGIHQPLTPNEPNQDRETPSVGHQSLDNAGTGPAFPGQPWS